MLSFKFLCHTLPLISFIGPFVNASVSPYNEEPVHFTRSSSLTQSTTSSTTHSQSVQSSVVNQPVVVVRSFPLGQDGVNCQYQSFAQGRARKGLQSFNTYVTGSTGPQRTVANLTPFNCHVQCLPPSSTSPNMHDCQKIIKTMRKMNQRSITVTPENWLYVTYRNCAVVFENRNSQNLAVKYQWNRLAEQADRLRAQCASRSSTTGNAPGFKINGRCFFASCDLDKSIQNSFNSSGTNRAGNNRPSGVDNSGIIITFQKK